MPKGLKPRKPVGLKEIFFKHKRRYSYSRTFGSNSQVPDFILPTLGRKNQNVADPYWGNPPLLDGCTGFATAAIAEIDLLQLVDPKFTYDKTLLIQKGKEGDACTLEDSMKSATVFGVRLKGETDTQALAHRRDPYFTIHPDHQLDWFDSVISAAYTNKRPVSLGTEWSAAMEHVGSDGIQRQIPGSWDNGHDHNAIGKKTINGVEYVIDDSWNGEVWGDHGLNYWSREFINAVMSISGSDALTNAPATPGQIQRVEINVIEVLLSLLERLVASGRNTIGTWTGGKNLQTS